MHIIIAKLYDIVQMNIAVSNEGTACSIGQWPDIERKVSAVEAFNC